MTAQQTDRTPAPPPAPRGLVAEATATLLVIAKRPVPGRVKTRLQTAFSPEEAAALAEASLRDTLDALAASPAQRRVVALDIAAEESAQGGGRWLPDGFDVVPQGGGGLDERLATAFEAVLGDGAPGRVDGPALLVGMDTPQLTPELLDVDWTGLDAVLGLATDGGYWAIGFRRSIPEALRGVPMSTDHTGAAQLARLRSLGLRVGLLPWLRDVDLPADAAAAAAMAPSGRFAAAHARFTTTHARDVSPLLLLEEAFAGAPVDAVDGRHRRPLAARAWSGDPDPVDEGMLDRCRGAVLDVGCGPGRMVTALVHRGESALGIDVSPAAVSSTAARGGSALRRRVQDRLPGEGNWGTVLLADGNIGIDGDPLALLGRCTQLLAPGGRVVVEAEAGDDELDVRDAVVLEAADGRRSRPLPWARLGAAALVRLAARCDLHLVERWDAAGRVSSSWSSAPTPPVPASPDAVPAADQPDGRAALEHTTAVQVVHLLVSPVHRYFGRPRDGPLGFDDGPGAGAGAGPASEDREGAQVHAGLGIVGDRFYGKAAHLDAAVTLIAVEALEAVAAQLGCAPFDPLLARRNVVLRGAELEPLRGQTFALDCGSGPVLFAGRRPASPCAWMDLQLAPGAHAALRGRGGLRCSPLSSGVLRRGPAVLSSPVPLVAGRAGDAVLPRGGRRLP